MRHLMVIWMILLLAACGSEPVQPLQAQEIAAQVAPVATADHAAARGVLERLIGERAADFSFEEIPAVEGRDVYEIEASGGRVTVRGSSGVAMARGAYDYLRETAGVLVSWSGNRTPLPESLPDMAPRRVQCPHQYRLFYNVCAFGYTTAYWDWPRWEQELDWLALHGFNMPLAMVGQEAIWQRVWLELGLSQQDLDRYFTGPAFLPWNRMGNVNFHAGPLPQSWHTGQTELQKKILGRMRELGMEPVVPAFAGLVPAAFKQRFPAEPVHDIKPWAGFPPECGSFILDPTSPMFEQIGRRFIEAWREEFGPARYYLADSFNELEVPVTPENRYEKVAHWGEAVYKAIAAGDPDGVWMMQGWIFNYQRRFWDKPSTQALLSRVPDDRMVIIDLGNEQFHGWEVHEGFYGKGWLYSVIHNFGGNNAPMGDLRFFASDPPRSLAVAERGNQLGFAVSPEGIENNDVVYELLADMGWSQQPIELEGWLADWCRRRYGSCPPQLAEAWALFLQGPYQYNLGRNQHGFQRRPSVNTRGMIRHTTEFKQGLERFLSVADQFADQELYRTDAVEFTVHYLAGAIDWRLDQAVRAHEAGLPELRDRFGAEAITMIEDADALLATGRLTRLDRWINFARQWGTDEAERDFHEVNARRQVTVWGGHDPLSEYANKVWSGLLRDYYAPRWRLYFEGLRTGQMPDIRAWQEQWVTTPGLPPMPVAADPIAEARRLIAVAEGWAADPDGARVTAATRGVKIGGWTGADIASTERFTKQWELTEALTDTGVYEVRIDHAGGRNAMVIYKLELIENGDVIAADEHRGTIFVDPRDNVWRLPVERIMPGAVYSVRAEMHCGHFMRDSRGDVWARRIEGE